MRGKEEILPSLFSIHILQIGEKKKKAVVLLCIRSQHG